MLIEWLLRAFGLFWVGAGIFLLRTAWQSHQLDRMLEMLQPGEKEDRLVNAFLFTAGILTLLSGLSLLLASRWSPAVVGLLVLAQALYFLRQARRARSADPDVTAEAGISQKTWNAFVVSVVVWVVSWVVF